MTTAYIQHLLTVKYFQQTLTSHRRGVRAFLPMEKSMRSNRLSSVSGVAILLASCSQSPPDELLDPWPFSVDRVELTCHARRVYATAPDGTRYGVNGSAKGDAPDVEAIMAHWDSSAVITRGLTLCDEPTLTRGFRGPVAATKAEMSTHTGTTVSPAQLGGLDMETTQVTKGLPGMTLRLHCGDGAPQVWIDLVRAPKQPPPLAGVYALLAIDGAPAERIEMSWLPEANWTPRGTFGIRPLARRLAKAKVAMIDLPAIHAPGGSASWTIAPSASDRAKMLKTCG